jgi:hypothetical protein
MDASQASSARADVTINAALPDEAVSRELARGILVSGQVVIVPNPPLELLRTSDTLTAVVPCVPVGGNPPEEIPVAGITRLRLRGTDLESACAVLRLSRSTQCVPAGPRHSIPQLAKALRSHQGNLWEAMSAPGRTSMAGQQEGAMTTGLNDGDGPWDDETNSLENYLIGICNVCGCCRRARGRINRLWTACG